MWLGRTMTLTGEQPRAGIAGHCRSDTAKLVGCAWFLDERQGRCSGLIAMVTVVGCAGGQQRIESAQCGTKCWPWLQRVSALQPA